MWNQKGGESEGEGVGVRKMERGKEGSEPVECESRAVRGVSAR